VHELSICQALIAQVEQVMQEQDGTHRARHETRRAVRITVMLGPLAGIEPGLLARAFTIARPGTAAAQAELVIEPSDITVSCLVCGRQSAAQVNRLLCAACGSFRTRVVKGEELLLLSVELHEELGQERRESLAPQFPPTLPYEATRPDALADDSRAGL
jgi:hydrogenase nickel incorporation protein HypA/HybF